MNKLEILNAIMEKQEHGVTVPINLNILLNGQVHEVTIDREDRDIQKIIRVLVMMMLRSEVGKTSTVVNRSEELLKKIAQDYTVIVRIGWCSKFGPIGKKIVVRAHSPLDARVMAFILNREGCPDAADQETIIALALENTELV